MLHFDGVFIIPSSRTDVQERILLVLVLRKGTAKTCDDAAAIRIFTFLNLVMWSRF